MLLVDAYSCTVCGLIAPPLDSFEVVAWRGGELAYYSYERDPVLLWLTCPDCVEKPASLTTLDRRATSPHRKAA